MKFLCSILFFVALNGFGAIRYVDNSLTNSANTGTNWANAWTNFSSIRWQYNFQSAPYVGSGDTLYISGGSSNQVYGFGDDPLYIYGGPNTSNLVTVTVGVEEGHNGTVIFEGNSDAHQATNVNWNGNGVGGTGAFLFDGGSSSNFVFRNWYNTNNYAYATAIGNCSPTHATMTRFSITNCGSAVTINPAIDFEMSYFKLEYIRGDHGLYIVSGSNVWDNVRIHHGVFRSNTTLTTGGGPDGASADHGTTIHDCEFWNDPNGDIIGEQHPDAIQGGGNYLKIYNNTFHNWTGAAHSADPAGTTIHDIVYAGNLFVYDNTNFIVCTVLSSGYVEDITAISNIYWLNNTIVDYGAASSTGIGLEWEKAGGGNGQNSHPVVTNYLFKNNLFYRVGQTNGVIASYGSYANTNFSTNNITLENNLTYTDEAQGSTRLVTALTNYWQQSPLLTNQPLFVDYTLYSTNSDFRLADNDTAALGQGTNLTALYAELGIPTTDRFGAQRPADGAWNIGAYEATAEGYPGRPDETAPSVAVTSPASTNRWHFTLTGTASDNVGVDHVTVSVNGVSLGNATGTTNWSMTVDLKEGANTIVATAFDFATNNASTNATISFSPDQRIRIKNFRTSNGEIGN